MRDYFILKKKQLRSKKERLIAEAVKERERQIEEEVQRRVAEAFQTGAGGSTGVTGAGGSTGVTVIWQPTVVP